MKPTCSVIIRAYNEERHIGRLLTGIRQQTLQDVQVILVDSGSTDATVEIAQRHFPVEVVSIRPEEFTFGRSLNLGISHASADWVVMASAHVYPVYPDWLERLLGPLKDGSTAAAYGKQRGTESTHFSEHEIFRHWYPEHSVMRQNTPFCNNANAVIQRSLWEQHNYDESLPALEDLAWTYWAHKQGYYISYVAEAEIIHVHQETWRGIFNRYRREGMAFKQIYPNETFRLSDLVRLFFTNVSSDWKAARQQRVWPKVWLQAARFRWYQFYGTYQGYRQSGPLTWQLKQAFYYPRQPLPGGQPPAARDVDPIDYN
jgi:rhamnosyltransferase